MPQRPATSPPSAAPLTDAPPADAAGGADLAARYGARLRLFALRRLRNPAEAEDAAQETLRRVLEADRAGRIADPAALPGFIFSTARHVCAERHRAADRESRALRLLTAGHAPLGHADALAALISEERRRAVRNGLARLGADDRELLRLLFWDGADTGQVARRLALSAGAVRVRKHRALRRLAELLADERRNDSDAAAT